ncbi:MAG: hypothetical protein Q8P68_05700 [Candidatus Peregrinibacteria bacterium]|nr:hypothetical protein [Candidatus Peregrinibacteria bacterium]MDZ4244998.1 hypothetical protein [Candidatus Gracilibacteria bacterium]
MNEHQDGSEHTTSGRQLAIAMGLVLAMLVSAIPDCINGSSTDQDKVYDLSDDDLGNLMYEIEEARIALGCGPIIMT